MDELKRLRIRAGIAEEFDLGGATAAPSKSNNWAEMTQKLGQMNSRFADELLEARKVMHNMSSDELWMRIALSYLQTGGR